MGVVRFDFGRAPITVQRFFELVLLGECIAQMVVRSRVNVGIEAQCLFEARRRLLEVLQCLMRQREVVMRIGRLRLQSDRTLDAVDRKVRFALLVK